MVGADVGQVCSRGMPTVTKPQPTELDAFLKQLESEFAPRRFTNAADAFDTVKAYVLDRAAKA